MATEIGRQLRAARTRQGIELAQVERQTKIRERYLRAIEEGAWELLPGDAYARGFLATYARLLGLDEHELLAEYSREHETGERLEPIPEEMLPRRGSAGAPILGARGLRLALGAAAVAVAIALVLGLTGGSDDSNRSDRRTGGPTRDSRAAPSTPKTTTTEQPSGVAVKLQSTGTVWVCLLGDRGRELIDGETLTASEARGPFEADRFEVTFGNGAIEMAVDGQPFDVPVAAEPLGYRITPDGVSELASGSQPTCSL